MGRHPDSGKIDLRSVFRRAQRELRVRLESGDVFENPNSSGAAAEAVWLDFFRRYLPRRFRAAGAFIVDAGGRRSRQIDIAIYDGLDSPILFPDESGLHLPAESVCAVFEVKHTLNAPLVRDAGVKAASVRRLRRQGAGRPGVVAGILASDSVWTQKFGEHLTGALQELPAGAGLQLGCILADGGFAREGAALRVSSGDDALFYFYVRLVEELRTRTKLPPPSLAAYGRGLDVRKVA